MITVQCRLKPNSLFVLSFFLVERVIRSNIQYSCTYLICDEFHNLGFNSLQSLIHRFIWLLGVAFRRSTTRPVALALTTTGINTCTVYHTYFSSLSPGLFERFLIPKWNYPFCDFFYQG